MRKSFTCFILLALFASQALSSSRNTFLNAFASLNGEVPISKDENGLFVEVDFIEKPQTAAGTAKMLVSLVSPYTIMAGDNCLGFTVYDCEHLDECKLTVNKRRVIAPYLTVETQEATTQVFLDHKSWHLKANALITDSCDSHFSAEYGKGRQGIIGLGIKEGSDKNYQQENADKTLFSVSMKKDLSGGNIYFSAKESLTSSLEKKVSLKVQEKTQEGSDWTIPQGTVSFTSPKGTIEKELSVIFDIHADATGCPGDLLKLLKDDLANFGVKDCSDSFNKPTCKYSGKISDLPTFSFELQKQKLSFPPEIYVQQAEKSGEVILNFKMIDPLVKGEVFIDLAFEKTLVLGGHFMSYYYTVFKADGIEIYGPKSGSGPWLYVGIGAVVIIAFVATFLYVQKNKKGSASKDSMLAGSYEASS